MDRYDTPREPMKDRPEFNHLEHCRQKDRQRKTLSTQSSSIPSTVAFSLPSPTVYRLASERRYGEIPIHVKASPSDIYWEDRYGSTALHVLCCSRHLESPALLRAIDSIVKRDANLIRRPNDASWTPLHLLCNKPPGFWSNNPPTGDELAIDDLIIQLVMACPEATSIRLQTGSRAKTPFHFACETDASLQVLKTMLAVYPSIVRQRLTVDDSTASQTPLEILWNKQQIQLFRGTSSTKLPESLQKMEALLEKAFMLTKKHRGFCPNVSIGENINQASSFSCICAMSYIRCPRTYMIHMMDKRRQEISTPDKVSGLLPLHYAILSSDEEGDVTIESKSFVITHLVEEYPEAAVIPFPPSQNIFPLHVAVADNSLTWHRGGIKELLEAAPNQIIVPDPRNGLVPALASAINADKSRQHLSTTFELLRYMPTVLQS